MFKDGEEWGMRVLGGVKMAVDLVKAVDDRVKAVNDRIKFLEAKGRSGISCFTRHLRHNFAERNRN